MAPGKRILDVAELVIGPKAILAICYQARVPHGQQVARSLGLRDREGLHDVANAQLAMVEEQPKCLQSRLVGKDLEEFRSVTHYIRIAECTNECQAVWRRARLPIALCLQCKQPRVACPGGEKLVMGTLLDDAPLFENHDPIGHAHRRESV